MENKLRGRFARRSPISPDRDRYDVYALRREGYCTDLVDLISEDDAPLSRLQSQSSWCHWRLGHVSVTLECDLVNSRIRGLIHSSAQLSVRRRLRLAGRCPDRELLAFRDWADLPIVPTVAALSRWDRFSSDSTRAREPPLRTTATENPGQPRQCRRKSWNRCASTCDFAS